MKRAVLSLPIPSEKIFNFIEEALLLRIDLVAADLAELLEEFFLALVEVLRREHLDVDELVAAARTAQERDAAVLDAGAGPFPTECRRDLEIPRAA